MRSLAHRLWRSFHYNGPARRFLSNEKTLSRSSQPRDPGLTTNAASKSKSQQAREQQNRLDKLLRRTPKVLHRHISALRSAPFTHIGAFLILHEITAIVPLFGLAGVFHYYQWLPSYFSEGAWVVAGVEKFGRYFKRKGWITSDEENDAARLAKDGNASDAESDDNGKTASWWTKGEGGVRIVVEFATAYAIVKALLIPRLMLSAWAAPWFARWSTIPIKKIYRRLVKRT